MRFIVVFSLLFALVLSSMALAAEAPYFELEALDGEEYALGDILGKCDLLVIDFWQVGCKPCNVLVAHLQEFYDEYQDEGVEFVIISRDTALTLAQVGPFFRSQEYTFRVLLDTELDVSKDFGVKAAPVTFIINPEGEIIWQHYNYKSGQEKEIEEVIVKYLAGEEIEFSED